MNRQLASALVLFALLNFVRFGYADAPLLPPAPLRATAESAFQISLHWSDRSSSAQGFKIERSTDGKHFAQIAQVSANTTSYRDDGLTPGTTYFYRVFTWNATGRSAYSNPARTRTAATGCALSVVEWGYPRDPPPSRVSGLVAIAAGESHELALRDDGTVLGWGQIYYGPATPQPDLTNVVAIAAGAGHSLALKQNGTVVSWGYIHNNSTTPPNNLTNVVAIAAGGYHNLALKADGTVVAWGDAYGFPVRSPTNLTGIVAIAAGGNHGLALRSDATVVGWGYTPLSLPTPPPNLTDVIAIAAGRNHSIALKRDGTVVCWGDNSYGQSTPPANLSNIVAIAAGGSHSLALRANGTVVGWGNEIHSNPTPTTNLTRVVAISAGHSFSMALTALPAAPSGMTTKLVSATQLRLFWTNNSVDASSFTVERILDDGTGSYSKWVKIGTVAASQTSFDDANVVTNTAYWYRVQAHNACGASLYPEPIVSTIRRPQPPYYFSASIGVSNHVNLDWYSFEQNVDGYTIERAIDIGGAVGPWTEIASVPSTNDYYHFYHDPGVTARATYWYRIRSFNILGSSEFTGPERVTLEPPHAPSELSTRPFADRAILSWRHSSDYQEGVAGFKIERALGAGGSPGSWTEIALLPVTNAYYYYDYTDPGRAANTTYWYRVRAFNWIGDSPYGNPASVTIVPPVAPQDFAAFIGSTNQVRLSWSHNFGDQEGFKLERAPDISGNAAVWMEIANVAISNTTYASYIDSNVSANTTNWYRVRAFNVLGLSPYSLPISVSVVPPPAPPNLLALPFANQVNLSWQKDYSGDIDGYRLERALDAGGLPGPWTFITNVSGNYFNFTDTGLEANATYWYRIATWNWIGASPFSDPVPASIVPPATPNSLSLAIGTTNTVELSWHSVYPYDEDGFEVERAFDDGGVPGTWTPIGRSYDYFYGFFADTNVVANTTNWYRIRSFNIVGVSDYTQPECIHILPPPEPYDLVAASFANRINLYWYEDYPGEVGGYKIERAADMDGLPGPWLAITNTIGSSTHFTDAGLSAGVAYWYRVAAYNWVGESPFSEPASARINPPAPPSDLFASVGTTNQVELTCYAVYPYEQDGFLIERAGDSTGNPGEWSQIGTAFATNFQLGYFADTNVLANTTNWYRIRAFNVVGISAYSQPTRIAVVPPSAPYHLVASPFADQANLSWRMDYPGVIGGYQMDRATDVSGSPGVWSLIAIVTNNYLYFTDHGLMANTKYWYRARAHNWVGISTNSNPASVTIVPPSAPTLYASLYPARLVGVTFYASYPYDQEGFKLERASASGNAPGVWSEIATVSAPTTSQSYFADTNITANTTNWYRARAFNAVGTSAYSPATSVPIVPPSTPSLHAPQVFRDQVTLSWYSAGADGVEIERAIGAGGSPGVWTQIANVTDTSYYRDVGLSANTTYWYRIRAYSWVGDSAYGTPVRVNIIPPAPPFDLFGRIGTTNHIYLSWRSVAADQDGFRVERATAVGADLGAWTEIGTVFATNLYYAAFADSNVLAHTTNWYRVRSFNSLGTSDYSLPLSVAVVPPPAPYYIAASPFADSVNLWWYEGYSGEVGGYQIDRALDVAGSPGVWSVLATVTSNYTRYADSGLMANNTYWYRARAYNWVGVSPNSNPTSVTIVSPGAPSVSGTIGTTNQVELSIFAANPQDQDGFKLERAPAAGDVPGAWTEIATLNASNYYAATYTDTNVTANTTNWYRARSFNTVGVSPYSFPISVGIVPPGQPMNLDAELFDPGRVFLSWNSHSAIAEGYLIERATNAGSGPGNWTQLARVLGQYTTYYSDYTIRPGGAYWYRVRAYNWVGNSPYAGPVGVNIPGVDKFTLHLWHLDEAIAPCFDSATGTGNLLSLTGGARLSPLLSSPAGGHSLSTLDGGQDAVGGTNSDAVLSAAGVDVPSDISYCDLYSGAFTYEAIVHIGFDPAKNFGPVAAGGNDRNAPFQILNADGNAGSQRIFQWRINPIGFASDGTSDSVRLEFINLHQGNGIQSIITSIPTDGPEAIVSNRWYHVAVTYNGTLNEVGNIKFYWTQLETNRTQATLLDGSRTMNSSLAGWMTPTVFTIGNAGRNPGGNPALPLNANFVGRIDEVRISAVARAADEMLLANNPAANAHPDTTSVQLTDSNLRADLLPLPPSIRMIALKIISVTPAGPDILVTWRTPGGTTNFVQAAAAATGPFFDISPPLESGASRLVELHFRDIGAATNATQRFYRVRLQ